MANVITSPPINVFGLGISLIPRKGNHTQNIPPTTSVKDNRVKSATGRYLDFIENIINPIQTKRPCKADKDELLNVIKILLSLKIKTQSDKPPPTKPATATVVNFGVPFFHLKETEKIAKPNADKRPLTKPNSVPILLLSKAMYIIPEAAITIAIRVVLEIFSFKKKYPKIAAIKGIAAIIRRVTAAEVWVIDKTKVILQVPKPTPPINPEIPILL